MTQKTETKRSVEELEARKQQRDEENADDEADWTHIVSQEKKLDEANAFSASTRSIFDDVDT
jgi:hypothetical protein